RSSFSRILTKLYGGHGPVYLNVSLSNVDAISLMRRSKAGSWSRWTRKAAFMIILSPMARFTREAAVLHAREVSGPLLRGDLGLQPVNVLVLLLDGADDLVAVPEHLEAVLELVLHLRQHVGKRVVGRAQQLDDVFTRLENRAERHRDDGVIAHHRLVDAFVRQDVLARGIERRQRDFRDDRRHVLEVDRVDLGPLLVHADG